jgi:hypothetical protein
MWHPLSQEQLKVPFLIVIGCRKKIGSMPLQTLVRSNWKQKSKPSPKEEFFAKWLYLGQQHHVLFMFLGAQFNCSGMREREERERRDTYIKKHIEGAGENKRQLEKGLQGANIRE